MIRIDSISRLRNCGIFRNFTWPPDLPGFGRYNVIYGWNGTGKTTLSRLFRDLEVARAPTIGEAVLHINGNDVPGESFPQSTLHVRVFNRDFIEENVFPVEGGDMPPILVLGSESVEKQRMVERAFLTPASGGPRKGSEDGVEAVAAGSTALRAGKQGKTGLRREIS